jgi:uncharacterized protein (DUF488 family)
VEIYTIGFTQKSAADFFGILKGAGIRRVLDIRLNNVSQLAGFSKRDDLAYFLREICEADYCHEVLLAPTQEILDAYKKSKGTWQEYEQKFLQLMSEREIERRLDHSSFQVPTVLLCSEPTAQHCHRRLVAEYLQRIWGGVEVTHL